MRKLTAGILAHVDAGKTTLSEAMLFQSKFIKNMGRVDQKNAFLDTFELEKNRGITIFSKQAIIEWGDTRFTLLDTPGHVDFSAEMERTLQVMDYGILVISATEGVQSHTMTLWKLLERYQIPTFIFVNKMDTELKNDPVRDQKLKPDQEKNLRDAVAKFLEVGEGKELPEDIRKKDGQFQEYCTEIQQALMQTLKISLDGNCINFSGDRSSDAFMEAVAMCDEDVLEHYLEEGEVTDAQIKALIKERKLFPVYFGAAVRSFGVSDFLDGMNHYADTPKWPKEFGARVFKVSRDPQGNRLTFVKVTGGTLPNRMMLTGQFQNQSMAGEEDAPTEWSEKVNQIRIYSGEKFEACDQADAGSVCALLGLNYTYPGQGFGYEENGLEPMLEPVLNYQVIPPADCDASQLLVKLRQLEEEEPALHVVWDEHLKEIHVQVMGEIQIEILTSLIAERFGLQVRFDQGSIVYKETIANTVEGVGHFEPLRHYAEVHLLMEPGEPGSGIQIGTNCSEDLLAKNWQRLILTHLAEKEHVGVLMGAPITDIKITLVAGRAHLKHTMGGDFRQATYRAVRQGLMKAQSVLLEPWYAFRMELPMELIGRAMTDIQNMFGTVEQPEMMGELYVLKGTAPVSTFQNYQKELNTYSHGKGNLICILDGYRPCHNQDEVLADCYYDPELDVKNPPHSVFCSHGAGINIPWYEVEAYMHVDISGRRLDLDRGLDVTLAHDPAAMKQHVKDGYAAEDELREIFARTYGAGSGEKHRPYGKSKGKKLDYADYASASTYKGLSKPKKSGKEYLLVDGYNVIHAWPKLHELAEMDFGAARTKLMDILSNYQGYMGCIVILVFDAYKVKGGQGSVTHYHNIDVVYTKEAETADMYIEKTAHKYGRTDKVTVATSDGLEQVIIRGQGCALMTALELEKEMKRVDELIRETVEVHQKAPHQEGSGKTYLFEQAGADARDQLQQMVDEQTKNQPEAKRKDAGDGKKKK